MKNPKHYVMIILLFSHYLLNAQTHHWNWARKGGSNGWDHAFAMATDQSGHVYVRGWYDINGKWGKVNLVSPNMAQEFLMKYDSAGNEIWGINMSGHARWNIDHSLATDHENNVYLTGYFRDIMSFNGQQYLPEGEYDMFIKKIDSGGKPLWIQTAGGAQTDVGYSCATDLDGNVFVTGHFSGTFSFGDSIITSKGGKDFYITKIDKQGNLKWIFHGGGNQDDIGWNITTDQNNDIYLVGEFSGTIKLGNTSLTAEGTSDFFLLKLSENGEMRWIRYGGGLATVFIQSVYSFEDHIYIGGSFDGVAKFGSQTYPSQNASDGFILKYHSNGDLKQAQQISGKKVQINSLTVQKHGVYLTGSFQEHAISGSHQVSAQSKEAILIGSLDNDLNCQWLESPISEPGFFLCFGRSIVSNENSIIFCGEMDGSTQFGHTLLNGDMDMFVSKVNTIKTGSIRNNDQIFSIYPNPVSDFLIVKPHHINGDKELYIHSSGGELVLKDIHPSGDGPVIISTSDLKCGLYIIEIRNEKNSYREKFLKI